jgi:triosephosphate isomerase
MKKSTPLIVGNWKLNPVTMTEAVTLASAIARKQKIASETKIAIAPPFIYLSDIGKKIKKSAVSLVAQDVYFKDVGTHTGEISALQLKDLGVEYVIIGHSERRAMGESDVDVQQKVQIVLKHKLVPIVCIGERERDEQGNFFSFVEAQLRSLAEVLSATLIKKVVIAYEPIWAIGTGKTATADNVKEMQLFIETVLTKIYDRPIARAVTLLYGGSVKPQNAFLLYTEGGMNGFLVGGASLNSEDFVNIIKAVS